MFDPRNIDFNEVKKDFAIDYAIAAGRPATEEELVMMASTFWARVQPYIKMAYDHALGNGVKRGREVDYHKSTADTYHAMN